MAEVKGADALKFNTCAPQTYHCHWRGRERTMHFKGHCVVCRRRTYGFTDGENDPRGPLGDRASSPLCASDYDAKGPDVPLCFACGNEEPAYNEARRIAERRWERTDTE